MPLTQEELNKLDAASGLKTDPAIQNPILKQGEDYANRLDFAVKKPVQNQPYDTGAEIAKSLYQRGENIVNTVKDASSGITDYQNPNIIDANTATPEQKKAGGIANAIAQTGKAVAKGVGQLGAGVGDIFTNLFTGFKKNSGIENTQAYKDFTSRVNMDTLNPEIKNLLSKLGETAQKNPEVASALEDAINSTGLIAPAAGKVIAQTAKEATAGAVDTAAQGIKNIVEPVVSKASSSIEKKAASSSFEDALKIIKPELTNTEKELAMKQGRVTTSGITRKTTVTPSVQEQRIADAVSPLVNDGKVSTSALPESNIDAIGTEVSRINSDVKNFIADKKSPFNEKQLRTKLNAVKDDSKIVFASDPTVEKTYSAVVDEFVRNVKSKDTLGLFEARQSFDQIPAIKKLLQNEKLGENVKRQIVLDVRRAANNYVSDLLPENSPFRALLKQESYLLEAIDNIANANKGRIDTNAVQRLAKKYPWLKYAISGTAGATGYSILSN